MRCRSCDASRPLSGITTAKSFEALGVSCSGRQPWEAGDQAQACTRPPLPLQRGASNLYFSRIESAIEIPPESDYSHDEELELHIKNTDWYKALLSNPNGPIAGDLVKYICSECDCSAEVVMAVVNAEVAARTGRPSRPAVEDGQDEMERLTAGEWNALTTPQSDRDDRSRFVTEHVPVLSPDGPGPGSEGLQDVAALIDKVVLVTKLREVRALVGFRRYRPDAALVKPDLGRGLDWLPAIEVFGEGVFLSLNEEAVARWEAGAEVRSEAARLEARRSKALMGERLPEATPRFILLHTLSHLIMRQLAFDCGYSSASLRERIYAREPGSGSPQLGILIYTAAGDVEGTLGGLCRNGQPPRMAATVLAALRSCVMVLQRPHLPREQRAGVRQHQPWQPAMPALLAPETSCVYGNALLDRSSSWEERQVSHGFFGDALEDAVQQRL